MQPFRPSLFFVFFKEVMGQLGRTRVFVRILFSDFRSREGFSFSFPSVHSLHDTMRASPAAFSSSPLPRQGNKRSTKPRVGRIVRVCVGRWVRRDLHTKRRQTRRKNEAMRSFLALSVSHTVRAPVAAEYFALYPFPLFSLAFGRPYPSFLGASTVCRDRGNGRVFFL